MKNKKALYVTRPSLPPLSNFSKYLEDIWESKWLTNNGKYHEQFEKALCDYLQVPYCSLFSNGTLALIVGLKSLQITGEVITTPFSFVASAHALYWNGITPVFCDIDEKTLNIDPDKIESLITPKTTAILAVHVYGNPCDVEKISRVADGYGLKVIYDAAHAFGVTLNGKSVLNYGDISILSFHATKVFTTAEGGAVVMNDKNIKKKNDLLKNFGFADEVTVVTPGINAKMNEIQAALGLLQLKYIDKYIIKRKKNVEIYRTLLKDTPGIKMMYDYPEVEHNYSYFPILINNEEFGQSRDEVYERMKKNNVYTRRYFYPLISSIPTYKYLPSASAANLPVAERIAKEVLCLPLYETLRQQDIDLIINMLLER